MWKNIKVYPWIPPLYEENNIFPYRTLVLGESNYTSEKNFNSNLVISTVEEHISKNSDKNFSRFATKIRRTILGRDTKVTAKEFWNSVAFYNFIQYRVGANSGDRPTETMWKESIPAFKELITTIKPERILVLGKKNWNNLTQHIEHEKISDCKIKINYNSSETTLGYITHPSSGGGQFTYDKFVPIAQELIFN